MVVSELVGCKVVLDAGYDTEEDDTEEDDTEEDDTKEDDTKEDDTKEDDAEDGGPTLPGILEKMGSVLDGVGVHEVPVWVERSGVLLDEVGVTGVLGEPDLDALGELELIGVLLATLELLDVKGAQAVSVIVTVSTSEKEKLTPQLLSHEGALESARAGVI